MIAKVFGTAMLVIGLFLGGCASIINNGPRTINIGSTPPGAKVSIYDRSNKMISAQTTPFVANLTTKHGYFKGQNYRLVFEMEGYTPSEVNLESKVSGWYWGNLLFGGLIGMLIVDPLTGAMYNLSPESIEQPLTPTQASALRDGEGIMVILVSQATEHERASMVRVN